MAFDGNDAQSLTLKILCDDNSRENQSTWKGNPVAREISKEQRWHHLCSAAGNQWALQADRNVRVFQIQPAWNVLAED